MRVSDLDQEYGQVGETPTLDLRELARLLLDAGSDVHATDWKVSLQQQLGSSGINSP